MEDAHTPDGEYQVVNNFGGVYDEMHISVNKQNDLSPSRQKQICALIIFLIDGNPAFKLRQFRHRR